MKRLPLILAIILGALSFVIVCPILVILYLLGASNVFGNYIDFLNNSIMEDGS